MASIATLLRVELIKLTRRPMTWTLSAILVGLVGFMYLMMMLALLAPESAGVDKAQLEKQILLPDGLYFASTIAGSLVTIMIIILAAGSVGSELSWATVRTNLLMGATRTRFLIAKLLALEIFAFIWMIIANLLALVGAVVTAAATNNAVPNDYLFGISFAQDFGLTLFHSIIVLAVWTLIAAAITLITGSLAAGLGLSLVMTLLGSQIAALVSLLGEIGKWVSRAIPNRALDSIVALDATSPPSYVASDWIWIVLSIVGWSAIFAFLAWRRFQNMNLVGTS